jgi:hypothetical protein
VQSIFIVRCVTTLWHGLFCLGNNMEDEQLSFDANKNELTKIEIEEKRGS